MDVLRKPLLNDEARREAFFEAMPELFLYELLNELKHHRYFAYSRINTLESYAMLVSRESFTFERNTYQQIYTEFKSTFDRLNAFMEKNLFTEDAAVVLQPILREKEPELYKKLTMELDELCHEVADRYKRLVGVFSRDSIPVEKITSVTRVSDTLHFDDQRYKVRSKEKQGLIRSLWDARSTKKGIKEASWLSPANVAVSMGLIDSARDFTDKVADDMQSTIKDMNKYLRTIGFPMEIKRDKDGNMLIVITN